MTTIHHHALAATNVDALLSLPEVAQGLGLGLGADVVGNDGPRTLSLALLWRELVLGRCRVVEAFFGKERCYIVTAECEASPAPKLDERAVAVLELLLRGHAQKSVAFDLGMAASTVAVIARRALKRLGITGKPSRVHPLLMLAASVAVAEDEALSGMLGVLVHEGQPLRVVSVPRPERWMLDELPNAERAIVEYLVEGHSHAKIARLRGTSLRTVANQISSVFRRFRVTGRAELICRLFELGMARATKAGPCALRGADSKAMRLGLLPS